VKHGVANSKETGIMTTVATTAAKNAQRIKLG
jgi:hypothetical protein